MDEVRLGKLANETGQGACNPASKAGLRHVTRSAWANMIRRCYNQKDKAFKDYGARGIFVCDRWRYSFDNFLADMGPKPIPGLTIERENNNDGYHPGNCRWATQAEQNRNKRNNRIISVDGQELCQEDWCRLSGIADSTVQRRRDLGWTDRQAVLSPPRIYRSSGIAGVSWHRGKSKWQARAYFQGAFHYLGSFDTKEQAATAVQAKLRGLAHAS